MKFPTDKELLGTFGLEPAHNLIISKTGMDLLSCYRVPVSRWKNSREYVTGEMFRLRFGNNDERLQTIVFESVDERLVQAGFRRFWVDFVGLFWFSVNEPENLMGTLEAALDTFVETKESLRKFRARANLSSTDAAGLHVHFAGEATIK